MKTTQVERDHWQPILKEFVEKAIELHETQALNGYCDARLNETKDAKEALILSYFFYLMQGVEIQHEMVERHKNMSREETEARLKELKKFIEDGNSLYGRD